MQVKKISVWYQGVYQLDQQVEIEENILVDAFSTHRRPSTMMRRVHKGSAGRGQCFQPQFFIFYIPKLLIFISEQTPDGTARIFSLLLCRDSNSCQQSCTRLGPLKDALPTELPCCGFSSSSCKCSIRCEHNVRRVHLSLKNMGCVIVFFQLI